MVSAGWRVPAVSCPYCGHAALTPGYHIEEFDLALRYWRYLAVAAIGACVGFAGAVGLVGDAVSDVGEWAFALAGIALGARLAYQAYLEWAGRGVWCAECKRFVSGRALRSALESSTVAGDVPVLPRGSSARLSSVSSNLVIFIVASVALTAIVAAIAGGMYLFEQREQSTGPTGPSGPSSVDIEEMFP